MHGAVHAEFRQFAIAQVGHGRWTRMLADAGRPSLAPRMAGSYPDEDLVASIGLLAAATKTGPDEVLRLFGRALFPHLVDTYGVLIPPAWGALDLIEHTEGVIHRAIRLRDPAATPPHLRGERTSATEVRVVYDSDRRLCHLARGLLEGVGEHYGEALAIDEPSCLHRGDDHCELVVRTTGEG